MNKLFCSKCGIEKELCNFVKDKRYKSGYSCVCKKCHNERSKKYIKENYDKTLKSHRVWCNNHPKWVYERYKKYRLLNPEKVNQRLKDFHKKNPEKKDIPRKL